MRRNGVVLHFASVLLLLAGVYVGAMLLFQRRLLFPNPSVAFAPPRPADALQVWLPTAAGRVEAWFLPPLSPTAQAPAWGRLSDAPAVSPVPVIVFFHGNGELIDYLPQDFAQPRAWGLGVLLVEFPGYGRSSGKPTQQTVTDVALAAHDWVQQQPKLDSAKVIAYGRSLGGAAAAILAAERSSAALVLQSTFTSVRAFARSFWLPECVVLDPFDTQKLLTTYAGPVLLLHGRHDEVVPVQHSEQLAQASKRAELQHLPCGHNNCPTPWRAIRRFLAAQGMVSD